MALGFYPSPSPIFFLFATAFCLAGFATTLRSLGTSIPIGEDALREARATAARIHAARLLSCAIGLVLGVAISRDDSGGHAAVSLPRLMPIAAQGRLVSDSSPVRGGFRSYSLALERLELRGAGVEVELFYGPCARSPVLRVLARDGPPLDEGGRLLALGSFSGGAGGALFAPARELYLEEPLSPIDRTRSALRAAFRSAIRRIGRSSAGLLEALILGSKEGLGAEEAEAFKAAGCSHILALSGEHLSVLAVIALAALKPFVGPFRARVGAALLATAFMWIAGAGPSLARAVIMAWIGALASIFDRPLSWLDVLSLTFLAALPADPESARSLGFILSYLAVMGLALLGPRFEFCLAPILPPSIASSAAASLAAQAAVSPVLAFTFGSLQFAGILASMAAGPLVTGLMWWGMGAALVCALLPCAAPLAAAVSDLLRAALVVIMGTAAKAPPLLLPGGLDRALASLAVVAVAAFVYARPYAEYRSGLRTGDRRSHGSSGSRRAAPRL